LTDIHPVPKNEAFPLPSKMMPVVAVIALLPSLVSIILLIYCTELFSAVLISKACVASMTAEAHKKNIVIYLKKYDLLLGILLIVLLVNIVIRVR